MFCRLYLVLSKKRRSVAKNQICIGEINVPLSELWILRKWGVIVHVRPYRYPISCVSQIQRLRQFHRPPTGINQLAAMVRSCRTSDFVNSFLVTMPEYRRILPYESVSIEY